MEETGGVWRGFGGWRGIRAAQMFCKANNSPSITICFSNEWSVVVLASAGDAYSMSFFGTEVRDGKFEEIVMAARCCPAAVIVRILAFINWFLCMCVLVGWGWVYSSPATRSYSSCNFVQCICTAKNLSVNCIGSHKIISNIAARCLDG